MTKKENVLQMIKFTLLSASAGVIQVLVDLLFNELLHTRPSISYVIALTASVLYNFTLNRRFTFKSANNVPVAMLKVLGYYAVFGPLSYWVTVILADRYTQYTYVLLAGCMILNLVTEYLFDKYVVFRGSENTNDLAKKQAEQQSEQQTETVTESQIDNK